LILGLRGLKELLGFVCWMTTGCGVVGGGAAEVRGGLGLKTSKLGNSRGVCGSTLGRGASDEKTNGGRFGPTAEEMVVGDAGVLGLGDMEGGREGAGGGEATRMPPRRNLGGGGAPGATTGKEGKFWGPNTFGATVTSCAGLADWTG